jgi:alcohol dehydrogenase class IV
MAQAMGLTETGFDAFHAHICALLDDIGIPRTLADIGVPEDCAARIAAKALQDSAAGTNPRQASAAEVKALVLEAIGTGR